MAIKNATYKIYTGSAWDEIHFKTSALQVNETSAKVFLRPGDHTVNGKTFGTYDSSTSTWSFNGITLYASDILMQSGGSTIYANINTLSEHLLTARDDFEAADASLSNRITALEGIVSGSEGGSLADTYQTIAAAQEQHETLYENIQNGINTTLADYAMTSAVQSSVESALTECKGYTDEKIAALVNGAPETLNTLDELAAALKDNAGIVDTLNAAIGNKASQADFNSLSSDFSEVQKDVGALKTEIVNKAAADHTHDEYAISGAATTIRTNNLTANRVLISNETGKVVVSTVHPEKITFLTDVTSNIQAQLNGKASSTHTHANVRQIFKGSAEPTGMASGDIWISY